MKEKACKKGKGVRGKGRAGLLEKCIIIWGKGIKGVLEFLETGNENERIDTQPFEM